MRRRPRVLLGCSGSVATVKLPEMVVALDKLGAEVRVVLSSEAAIHFFIQSYDYNSAAWRDFEAIGGYGLILSDKDEWSDWKRIGDPVLHIDLRRWADVFVLAPASANTYSKCKLGLCDSLLLSVYRAWDFNKPVICAPAMNTMMWDNLNLQIEESKELGMFIIPPAEKMLACGDVGKGAMASVSTICDTIMSKLEAKQVEDDDKKDDKEAKQAIKEEEEVSHPVLLPGWIEKYKWSPTQRLKYFWRYSRFCTLYRTPIFVAGVIAMSVATGFAVMWVMSKIGHWQLLKEYEEQKGKLMDRLKEKAEHYKKLPDKVTTRMKGLAEAKIAEAKLKASVLRSGNGAGAGTGNAGSSPDSVGTGVSKE